MKKKSLEILYEDDWIIVVDKPEGMLSVGFPGHRGKTAEDILRDMKRSRGKIEVSAVHRLDRDTSGVMMFAKTAEAKKRIMDGWQEIVTERTYRAVCGRDRDAKPLPDSGIINAPLAYNRHDVAFVPREDDRAALKDAERAVTRFRVITRAGSLDLVECELETGRKNQIRAHMAHLGHPVAGDPVYGKDASRDDAGPVGRLALHARVLAFTHPFTGDTLRFESPEPAEFARAVKAKARTAQGTAKPQRDETARKRPEGAKAATGTKRPAEAVAEGAVKTPRRGRGRKQVEKPVAREKPRGRKEREEDLSDLAPVPRRSRTRQDTGKSRFIPGK
jgi:23S rRNA pseudouridine1911/1915/1917 synthase